MPGMAKLPYLEYYSVIKKARNSLNCKENGRLILVCLITNFTLKNLKMPIAAVINTKSQ